MKRQSVLAVGTLVGGQYEVREFIGGGAMGEVYLAMDVPLSRNVALKVVSNTLLTHAQREEFLLRFRAEAMAAAQLSHIQQIVTIYNFGEKDAHLWFAMQYVPDSQTLRDRCDELAVAGQRLPLDELHRYALDAATGLREIHAVGMIHRDIKPDNLLVYSTSRGPALKILDFGIVHLPQAELTRTGIMLGTPNYSAPEYYEAADGGAGRVKLDPRIDQFALGATLYRALTGETPFPGEPVQAMQAVKTRNPPLPTTIRTDAPVGWNRVIMRMIEKNPERRYPSMAAAYEELERIASLPDYEPVVQEATNPLGVAPKAQEPSLELPVLAPEVVAPLYSKSEVKQVGEAAAFAQLVQAPAPAAAPNKKPLATLPPRTRAALAAAAVVLAVLVLVVVTSIGRHKQEPRKPALAAADVPDAQPTTVTARDILADQRDARVQQVLEAERGQREKEQSAAVVAASTVRAGDDAPARRKENGPAKHPRAGLQPPAAPPPPPAAETTGRKRNVAAVKTFYEAEEAAPAAGTSSAKLGIATGQTVRARLVSALTSQSPSTVAIATLLEPVTVGGREALPKGTRIIGGARYRSGSDLIEVAFTKAVVGSPGTEIPIVAQATTAAGVAGLHGRITKRDSRTRANLAQGAIDVVDKALSGAPGSDVSRRFTQDGRSDARDLHDVDTIVTLSPNTDFVLQFTKAL